MCFVPTISSALIEFFLYTILVEESWHIIRSIRRSGVFGEL